MKKSTTIITTEVLRDVHFKTSTFETQHLEHNDPNVSRV